MTSDTLGSTARPTTTPPTTVAADPLEPLDLALDRLSPLEWPAPVPFANHGPMAAEALVALDAADALPGWVDAFERELVRPEAGPPSTWSPGDGWREALGDPGGLDRWRSALLREVEGDGWEATAARWVPRFAPYAASGLFHGVIRTAHAVRSLGRGATPARRVELAQALAHWACRARVGRGAGPEPDPDDGPGEAALGVASRAAEAFVTAPDIVSLHRVTGAMAVEILARRLPASTGAALVAQLTADTDPFLAPGSPGHDGRAWDGGAVGRARTSLDPHQVKLVEACARGFAATRVDAFAGAASVVTGRAPDGTVW